MSHKLGITNWFFALMVWAPEGIATLPVLPSAVIRLPETTTVMSAWVGAPVASITVTWVNANGFRSAGGGPWAKERAADRKTSDRKAGSALITTSKGPSKSLADSKGLLRNPCV